MADIRWLISPSMKLYKHKDSTKLHRDLDIAQRSMFLCHKELHRIHQTRNFPVGLRVCSSCAVMWHVWFLNGFFPADRSRYCQYCYLA